MRRFQTAMAAVLVSCTTGLVAILGAVLGAVLGGCASPGSPQPPSLHLPAVVANLSATRSGDVVELRFRPPVRSSDRLPLREGSVEAAVCRALSAGECVPAAELPGRLAMALPSAAKGQDASVIWRDPLPPSLRAGAPRAVGYRVELFNAAGQTAGYSPAAYALAGAAPSQVEDLTTTGSRLGILLQWRARADATGQVLLRRDQLSATAKSPSGRNQHTRTKAQPEVVWLSAESPTQGPDSHRTLDTSAAQDTTYRYTAVRQVTVHMGGRTLEMRSAESMPATIRFRPVYPPESPTGLTAVGYTAQSAAGSSATTTFAVDLIWQPVEDAGLAGYNVYRQPLDAGDAPAGPRRLLNTAPVLQSAFHDTTAAAEKSYQYSVTAVDGHGNESGAARAVLAATTPP